MSNHKLFCELDEIHYKYKRLTSMISLLQTVTAEMVDIAGIPRDILADSLYEIEEGMIATNEKLNAIVSCMGACIQNFEKPDRMEEDKGKEERQDEQN